MSTIIPDATWNNTTTISNIVPTYNIDNIINGYIVSLDTENISTGYIQIVSEGVSMQIISFSLEGEHHTSTLNNNELYYLGNLKFAYKTNDTNYKLLTNEEVYFTLEDLEEMATDVVIKRSKSVTPYNAHTLVSNFQTATMVKVGDFSGYNEHCSPTAGTNLINYWGSCRGMTNLLKNNGTTMTNTQIFQRLYTLMGTDATGTARTKIVSGIKSYMNERSIFPQIAYSSTGKLFFEQYIQGINTNTPLILSLDASTDHGYGNHSVFGVGYLGIYAIIIDGWSTGLTYINYDSLNLARYHHIGDF